jgi:hypothetical protein
MNDLAGLTQEEKLTDLNIKVAEALGLMVVNIPDECSRWTPSARWVGLDYLECDVWYAGTPEEIAEVEEWKGDGYDAFYLKDYAGDHADAWELFLKSLDPNRTSIHPWGNGQVGLNWAIYHDDTMIVSAPTFELAVCVYALIARQKEVPRKYQKYVVRESLE